MSRDKDPDELSDDEIDKFIRDFEEINQEFGDMLARLDPLLENHWRNLAGPELEPMLENPEEVVKRLKDANPNVRRVAVAVAYQRWQLIDTLKSVYEEIAVHDPDSDVRTTAMGALGTCYARTRHQRIGRYLASIVLDTGNPDAMRLTAFTSLLRLHGNMEYARPSPLVPTSLDEIDFDFVCQYCQD